VNDRVPQFLLCRAASWHLAIPIEHVIETMRALPLAPVAGTPRFMLGIAVIRGDPLPVVDAARLFGAELSRARRWVAMRAAERRIALAVDDVVGVRAVTRERCRELPPVLRHADSAVIAALGALDDELLVVLASARIVPESTWVAISEAAVVV
jgi:purine-binding chemotaxis protein CheW